MVSLAVRWLCLGLLVGVVGTMSGCSDPPNGGGTTGGQETPEAHEGSTADGVDGGAQHDDGQPAWGDDGSTLCGDRTVSSLPSPGFVEVSSSFDVNAVPADSSLAKVMLGGMSCLPQFDAGDFAILYEVGQQGEVLSVVSLTAVGGEKVYMTTAPYLDQRFVVTDGCLALETDFADQDEFPDVGPIEVPDESEPPGFDLPETPESLCEWGQLPVGHDGVAVGTQQGPYICVRSEFSSACHDCWVEDSAWHEESVFSGSYVALGSIDNVSVRAWATACGQPDQRVSIAEGDRVDFTWTTQTTYRTSPSPEDLGYKAFELPNGS